VQNARQLAGVGHNDNGGRPSARRQGAEAGQHHQAGRRRHEQPTFHAFHVILRVRVKELFSQIFLAVRLQGRRQVFPASFAGPPAGRGSFFPCLVKFRAISMPFRDSRLQASFSSFLIFFSMPKEANPAAHHVA
jgi:hypothetical protein